MRAFVKIFALAVLVLAAGFFVFVAQLPREQNFDEIRVGNDLGGFDRSEVGIVVFTGGSGERIERALNLYGTGVADRVLISGTHPQVTKSDLASTGDFNIIDCCVDLGPKAQTTIGNALEARDWARDNDYRAILLVTSDFHLPRARVELAHAAPDLTIIVVPVSTHLAPQEGWYRSATVWKILGREYVKFILSWTRSLT